MSLLGTGVLVNWGGVTVGTEDDYVAWHSREHMPERVGLPGFLRGRRAQAVPGTPHDRHWFMMYETTSPEVFSSVPYRARLDNPTPWTRRVLATYVAPVRTVCRVVGSESTGSGGWLATWQARTLHELPGAPELAEITQMPGIVGAHLLEGVPDLTTLPSAERRYRETNTPDDIVGATLIVEGLTRTDIEASIASARVPEIRPDIYLTQHLLSQADLTGL